VAPFTRNATAVVAKLQTVVVSSRRLSIAPSIHPSIGWRMDIDGRALPELLVVLILATTVLPETPGNEPEQVSSQKYASIPHPDAPS